jgi:hypothetical protein
MREAFVHQAVVDMEAGGDLRALGGAVTVALCGHWDHEPPCPLAPHHTEAHRSGDAGGSGGPGAPDSGGQVRLRVLFAAEPANESEVRGRIEAALGRGTLQGPGGVVTSWEFRGARTGVVLPDEAGLAEELIRHGGRA